MTDEREPSLSTAFKSSGVDRTIAGTVGNMASSFDVAPLESSLNETTAAGNGNAAEQEVGDTMEDTKQVMRFFSRTSGQ